MAGRNRCLMLIALLMLAVAGCDGGSGIADRGNNAGAGGGEQNGGGSGGEEQNGGGQTDGDGTGGTSSASPGGIFIGTVESHETEPFEVFGMITDDGEARFLADDGRQYVVGLEVDGSDFFGEFRGYAPEGVTFLNDERLTEGEVSGTIDERALLNGAYFDEAGDSGSFALDYWQSLYEQPSNVSLLAGQWGDGNTVTMNIDAEGRLFQQNGDCVINGQVSTINTDFNIYRVTMEMADCDDADGDYEGLLIWLPEADDAPEAIEFGVSTDDLSYVDFLPRI